MKCGYQRRSVAALHLWSLYCSDTVTADGVPLPTDIKLAFELQIKWIIWGINQLITLLRIKTNAVLIIPQYEYKKFIHWGISAVKVSDWYMPCFVFICRLEKNTIIPHVPDVHVVSRCLGRGRRCTCKVI